MITLQKRQVQSFGRGFSIFAGGICDWIYREWDALGSIGKPGIFGKFFGASGAWLSAGPDSTSQANDHI
jgi:hypothetical protein